MKWYEIKALGNGVSEVYIYGDIGANWDGTGVSADTFVQELKAVTSPTINLHINSFGGQVFEGLAIATAIKSHASDVHVFVDGVAASIGSIIAIAGDTCTVAANAYIMIHNPYTVAMGDSDELRRQADLLEKLRGGFVDTYAAKTGKPADEITVAMKKETWFTAEEAKAFGLCDAIGNEGPGPSAKAAGAIVNCKSAPKALRRIAAGIITGCKPEPEQSKPEPEAKPVANESESKAARQIVDAARVQVEHDIQAMSA